MPQTFRHNYVLYGTCNRLLRVPLGICQLAAWGHAGYYHPKFTLAYLTYCVWKQYPGYKKFFTAYPYMLTARNVLAAITCDYSWLIIGIWGLCTLSTDTWVHGDGNKAEKQPGFIVQDPQDLVKPMDNVNEARGGALVDVNTQVQDAFQITGATQNDSAGVLAGLGRIGVSDQEPVPVSACHPDADGNKTSRIPTYQESLHIFDALIKASEAQKNDGVHFPYKVPLTLVCEDGDGGLRSVTAMIPCETWTFDCVLNEDVDESS